jgi:hypothetical protein
MGSFCLETPTRQTFARSSSLRPFRTVTTCAPFALWHLVQALIGRDFASLLERTRPGRPELKNKSGFFIHVHVSKALDYAMNTVVMQPATARSATAISSQWQKYMRPVSC